MALILHFRHSILACKNNEEISLCVSKVNYFDWMLISSIKNNTRLLVSIPVKVTKETSEIVVNEAIELWQEHGGPIGLTITDLPKQK